MNPKVIAAREKAGQAVKDAREIGLALTAAEEQKLATVAELREKFERARDAATEAQRLLQQAIAVDDLERQHADFTEPATGVTNKDRRESLGTISTREIAEVAKGMTRRERMRAERHMKERLELFSAAGVKTREDLGRFTEAHAEAFYHFVLSGAGAAMASFEAHGFKARESMALVSTSGDLGGFLAPDEFRAEVIRDLAGIAVMRGMCRVEVTGASALVFPTIQSATVNANIYASGYVGAWKGEGYVTGGTAPPTQDQPKFDQSRTPVHAWAPDAIEVSNELLSDNKADLDGILAGLIAETAGLDEDAGFINGSGVGQPLGIAHANAGITGVNTGSSGALTYAGLVDLFTNLPSQYRQNAVFLLNSLTYGAILKLADTQQRPLFPVGSNVNELWTRPFVFSEFMPNIAAGSSPIIFGNFRYYLIADRQELRIQRLVERFAPNLGILPTARLGGQPLRKAAFRKQVCT